MEFSGQITLGNIAVVVTLITIAIGFGVRFGTIESLVRSHTQMLQDHSKRLDKYEERLVGIVGDVQRIVGRIESTQERLERKVNHDR